MTNFPNYARDDLWEYHGIIHGPQPSFLQCCVIGRNGVEFFSDFPLLYCFCKQFPGKESVWLCPSHDVGVNKLLQGL